MVGLRQNTNTKINRMFSLVLAGGVHPNPDPSHPHQRSSVFTTAWWMNLFAPRTPSSSPHNSSPPQLRRTLSDDSDDSDDNSDAPLPRENPRARRSLFAD